MDDQNLNLTDMEEKKEQFEIIKAEQQLTGFIHAKREYTLIDLVEAMGLTKGEWLIIKNEFTINYMNEDEVEDIDIHFGLAPNPNTEEVR